MTMIERVARVIYEADDPWSVAFPWPNLNTARDSNPEEYRRIARAAIEAMREPTVDMLNAMKDNVGPLAEMWRGAIDVALNEQVK